LYERYLELVRAIVVELASVPTRARLVDAEPDAGSMAARAIDRGKLRADGLDVELATAAAFALRARALATEEAAADRRRRVRIARERGDEWVVIEEAGDGVLSPFRGLEMHLPDGAGVATSIEIDLDRGFAVHRVQEVALDPDTGTPLGPPPTVASPSTFDDRTAWETAVAELKRRLAERSD
jgi:hypothetical protein